MTAPRLSAYQAFIIAAGELFSVLTAAAASPPPPERFMAAVSDAVATIDRAHSSLLLVASQDALTAAAEVVQRAHRIREFLDPYQRSPHGLGELTQEYASACNAFTRTARDEVGNERSLFGRRSLTCGNTVLVMRACGCLPVSACWRARRKRCSVKDPPAPGVRVVYVSLGGSLRPAVRLAGPITRRNPVNTPSSQRLARIRPHAIGH